MPVSLLMFDIDRFKSINDCHGHLLGDRVLVEVSRLVRENLRTPEELARWGARSSSP